MTDYIRNNKLLVIILLILVLSNAVLLFFLFGKRPPRKAGAEMASNDKSGGMRAYMKKVLKDSIGFTDAQVAMYDTMGSRHKDIMKPMFSTIQAHKDSFYKLLMQPGPSDSLRQSFLDKIAQDQRMIDERIFNHFYELRAMCTPDQQPRFDTVMQKMIRKMIAGPPRRSSGQSSGGRK